MGVIHKLKPEVIHFILDQKKKQPALGCRSLADLVQTTYKIDVSKSSVNAILKNSGYSMPVGRRRILEENEVELSCFGVAFLRAADFLLGGVLGLAEELKKHSNASIQEAACHIETILYEKFFDLTRLDCGLPELIGVDKAEHVVAPLRSQFDSAVSVEAARASLRQSCRMVRFIAIRFSDGKKAFCDPQFHTIWSSVERIPLAFEAPYTEVSGKLEDFVKGKMLALFMAPGYDEPTSEFLSFLSAMEGTQLTVSEISAFDRNGKEVFTCKSPEGAKLSFVIGLWPWQFLDQRVLEFDKDEASFEEPLSGARYKIQSVRYGLCVPGKAVPLTFSGLAVKIPEKIDFELVVISNIRLDIARLDIILNEYLMIWAEFSKILRDFSHKVEECIQNKELSSLSFENICNDLINKDSKSLDVLMNYLEILHIFVKNYFLPNSLQKSDFSFLKDEFYGLRAVLHKEVGLVRVVFQAPPGYLYIKELSFACQRLNERGIITADGRKMKFLLV